jgi:hypothetical protein
MNHFAIMCERHALDDLIVPVRGELAIIIDQQRQKISEVFCIEG